MRAGRPIYCSVDLAHLACPSFSSPAMATALANRRANPRAVSRNPLVLEVWLVAFSPFPSSALESQRMAVPPASWTINLSGTLFPSD